jgi:glycosyltransferase involved in cell wall biosynthesis
VTPYFYPIEGGVERHVFNLSREFVKLGHEVDVYTSNVRSEGEMLEKSCLVDGLLVRRFRPIMSLGQFGKVWPGFFPALIRGEYDVIHSHVFRHPHTDISNLASKVSGSTSVLTSHSPFHPSGVRKRFARALVPVYDNLLAKMSLKSFDTVISLTPAEARTLSSLSGDGRKIRIIPHGIEEMHFAKTNPEPLLSKFGLSDRQIVLYLGRIHPTKCLHTLVEAFAQVASEKPDASLVLAGPYQGEEERSYVNELKALIGHVRLDGKVIFTSRLSEEEKCAAYESSSVFVLPSLYEPYGIVLIEAAAHGKPLLSTRSDGPSSIIHEGVNGFLFSPSNTKELASMLALLLSDESLRKKLGENARKLAWNQRWDRVARETLDAYLSAGS